MKLCGLDFETANNCSGSICAIGAALLEDGVVLERREYLVKPHKSLDYIVNSAGMFTEYLMKICGKVRNFLKFGRA